MATVDVLDLTGKKVGTQELSSELFEAKVKNSLMHQVVVAGAAAQRSGTHSTKTRADVRGGGKKPWRQKGTGRARAGSTRAPQWAGGGVAHGPHPTDHTQRLPKKMRRQALRSALSARTADGVLKVVEAFTFEEPRTKLAFEALSALGAADGKVLVVLAAPDETAQKAFRNLPNVRVTFGRSLATYEVLEADHLLITKDALELIGQGKATEPEGGEAE
jgi:large subunit ribosomal protein L4